MSHNVDDRYEIYNERVRRASKSHACCACDLEIRRGDTYTYVFILFDGRKESYKRCVRCQLIHEHLRKLNPGEMWPDEQLACGTLYEEEWGSPPSWINELAFWRSGDPLPPINRCSQTPLSCRMRYSPDSGMYFGPRCHSRMLPDLMSSGTQVCS